MGCFIFNLNQNLFIILLTSLCFHTWAYANFCDELVCESDGQISIVLGNTSGLQNLGIRIPQQTLSIETQRQYTPRQSGGTQRRTTGGTQPQVQNANTGPSDTTTPQDQQPPASTASTPSGATTPTSSSPSTTTPIEVGGQGSSLVGGLLYSDDSEDSSTEEIKNETKSNDPLNINPYGTTANASTPETKAKKGGSSSPTVAGGSATAESPFGTFGSGGGAQVAAASVSAEGASEEALGKMNKESGFFGATGSRGSRGVGAGSDKLARAQNRQLASLQNAKAESLDGSALLLNRYNRGLASAPEFGDKNTFLFSSMCQHYKAYEKTHNINMGATTCPAK